MNYVFRYRRNLFWHSYKVIGHQYDAPQDKMILFSADGSVREIANWKACEVKLGTDWVLTQKKVLETQAGQPINLQVGV